MRTSTWVVLAGLWAVALWPRPSQAAAVDYKAKGLAIAKMIENPKQLAKAQEEIEALLNDPRAPVAVRAEALELRGRVLHKRGDVQGALSLWRESERMAVRIRHPWTRMRRTYEASAGYLKAGAWDDCLRAAKKALAIANQINDVGIQAQMCAFMSVAYQEKGQAEESKQARARTRAILRGEGGGKKVGWVGSRLRDVGRHELAMEILDEAVHDNPLAEVGDNLVRLGDRFRKGKNPEAALRCYRLGARCPAQTTWIGQFPRQCRRKLAELERERGNLGAALQHAKLFYLIADARKIQDAMSLVATILKAMDKEINLRVRQFLEFQRYGPAGKDGRPGTADDLKDPLADVKAPEEEPLGAVEDLLAGTEPLEWVLRTDICIQHRKYDLALAEALAGYRCATGEKLTDEVYLVATVLKALDGHLVRANQYLLYQKFGPRGQDGKTGTADDLSDPLGGIELQSVPGRDKRFQDAIAACDDSYLGLRRKGLLLLAWGKAEEGLGVMKEVYERCGVEPESLKEAILGVAGALKAVDGHLVRANQYLMYQKHGPSGPDGIKGTADDLTNPLAAEKAPAPPEPVARKKG